MMIMNEVLPNNSNNENLKNPNASVFTHIASNVKSIGEFMENMAVFIILLSK